MSEIINALVPIDAIQPHPRNYTIHPPQQIADLAASHKRFNQYRSVVIWQRPNNAYIQVAGHGILEAMKERGVTHVRADILPEETPEEDSEHGQRRVHPTQKPIALAEWAFEKYGKERDVIYDPFLGSGMSVIAAENLNRTVYGCELSPEYIDVICTRWEKHTGQTATLLERVEVPAHA